MNKKLIKKYKAEFDHWLNKGSVLMGKINEFKGSIRWYPSVTNPFTELSDSIVVVINDEYVEFRKALAEGKTIQCNARENQTDITFAACGHTWWEDTTEFKYATSFYRIKPEESQFKVGDFVRNTSSGIVFKYDYTMLKPDSSCCIKWTPQAGELCWFADSLEQNIAILDKFERLDKQERFNYESQIMGAFTYCEPFLNSKPSWFKD